MDRLVAGFRPQPFNFKSEINNPGIHSWDEKGKNGADQQPFPTFYIEYDTVKLMLRCGALRKENGNSEEEFFSGNWQRNTHYEMKLKNELLGFIRFLQSHFVLLKCIVGLPLHEKSSAGNPLTAAGWMVTTLHIKYISCSSSS